MSCIRMSWCSFNNFIFLNLQNQFQSKFIHLNFVSIEKNDFVDRASEGWKKMAKKMLPTWTSTGKLVQERKAAPDSFAPRYEHKFYCVGKF